MMKKTKKSAPAAKGMLGFIEKHYHHFNAMQVQRATESWLDLDKKGGTMFLTMAGAMSSARMGVSLAPLIRAGKIHGMSCTGANIEESLFRLIAHTKYEKYPDYRYFTKFDDQKILDEGGRRVTDMAIPEDAAFRVLEPIILKYWKKAATEDRRYFPHEYFYQVAKDQSLKKYYDGDPKECWILAAAEKNLPIVVPGAEDSTMGNIFASYLEKGELDPSIIKSGFQYMTSLYEAYRKLSASGPGLESFL